MNNTFNIKRFGNYFLYELNRLRGNFLLSAVILALLPAIFFVVAELYSFIFSGELSETVGLGTAPAAAFVALVCLVIVFPVKMYGSITEKRAGSNFLMIPVSTFEKWLGMILMTCVVMPLGLILSFLAVDSLMSLCFGHFYGAGIISGMAEMKDMSFGNISFLSQFSGFGYIRLACSILIFTLGAIYFKTSKIGKTILTLILIGFVVSTISSAIIMANIEGLTEYFASMDENQIDTIGEMFENAVWLGWIWYAIEFCALSGVIYHRLKTITH